MKRLLNDLWSLIRKPWFIVPLCLTAVIGYGYSMTHLAIGVDDLARSWYIADFQYIRQGRLMGWVLYNLLGTDVNTLYAEEALAATLMVAAAALWSALMNRAAQGKLKPVCLSIFACLFVSYPLIAEIWVYSGTNLSIALGYCLLALGLMQWLSFITEKKRWWLLPMGAALTATAYSMFEGLALAFGAGACAVLILRALYGAPREARAGGLTVNGLWGLVPLAGGILLDEGITRLAVKLLGREMLSWSTHQIAWTAEGAAFGQTAGELIRELAVKLGLFGLSYLPIGIFIAALIGALGAGVWMAAAKRRPAALIGLAALLMTLIALPLAQGRFTGYRACQQFAVFTAFIFMLLTQFVYESSPRQWLRTAAAGAAFVLALAQAGDLSRWLRLDYRRYQEEKRVASEIAGTLKTEYDLDKPVVFLGGYELSSAITKPCTATFEDERLRVFFPEAAYWPVEKRFVETSVQNYLSWSLDAYYTGSGEELMRFFSYLGFDGIRSDDGTYAAQAQALAKDMPSYPQEGYILETDEFILVMM